MADDLIEKAMASLPGMAQNAAKPEKVEPGPGDVGPTLDDKQGKGLVTLQMTEAQVSEWQDRIKRARAKVEGRETKWDILLNEYLPIVSESGTPETVKVQGHFRNVHSKIGQLFYRSPDLVLVPKDPGPANNSMPSPLGPAAPPIKMEDVVSVKQAVLTEKLGRDGIKINRLMDELLFDVLAWAGIGCAKLGYRCVSKPYNKPVMQPDPMFKPAASMSMLGLGAPPQPPPMVPVLDLLTGQPKTEVIPIPIFEEWYMRRFSPKKALWNDDLKSTRFDEDATFMAMDFYMSESRAMKEFGLSKDECKAATQDDRVHKYDDDQKVGDTTQPGLIHGIEVWCKASVYTDEVHPQAINQLVLIDGLNTRPVTWRPSPDQEFDEFGKLTEDSLIGFPIRILTIRDLADSAFPQSDAAFTNSEIKQLSTWRRQSIRIRDAAIGKYFYDMGAFDEVEAKTLKDGEVGAYIGVMAGKLAQGADKIFAVTSQIHATQDDYRGAELIQRDIYETLGIPPSQAGMETDTIRSATETAAVKSGAQARSEKELGRVVDFYLDAARMIDQLLMRYADSDEYVHIAGQDGAQKMMVWNKSLISGKYLYDIAPDSQMRVDTAQDFKMTLELYNQTAKDPMSNRSYLLRRLYRMRGLDPSKSVLTPEQMPKPEPEKPKISFAFSGEDLANPLVVALLLANKMITPEQVASNKPVILQPEHGGHNTPGETISQHSAANSGQRPNEPGSVDHRASQVK